MFTKKRFLSMPERQQHKICSDLLRQAHDQLLHDQSSLAFSYYQEIQTWIAQPFPVKATRDSICDGFHHHLNLAGLNVREHNLLVPQTDRPKGAPVKPIAIYLDRLRSAHNIGSIVRTTEAFSLGTLYFSKNMASIDHKQVQDAAMGSHQWVTCYQNIPLAILPRPIIALETVPNATSIHNYLFPTSFTLAVGNEEYGLSSETLSLSDHIVAIPLTGRKNSLNVANAFAIAAAEIQRQATSIGYPL